jgi:hypothetical protein
VKPDLIDYIFFALLVAALLAACRITKHRQARRKKPSPAQVLLPLVEQRPISCQLCPMHGVCKEDAQFVIKKEASLWLRKS